MRKTLFLISFFLAPISFCTVTHLCHPTDLPRDQHTSTLPRGGGSCIPALQHTCWGGAALVAFLRPPHLVCDEKEPLTQISCRISEIFLLCFQCLDSDCVEWSPTYASSKELVPTKTQMPNSEPTRMHKGVDVFFKRALRPLSCARRKQKRTLMCVYARMGTRAVPPVKEANTL